MTETNKRLSEWRVKALDVFLTAAALISFPVILIPVAGAFLNPDEIPGAIILSALFLILLGLAVFRKVDPSIRGWMLIVLGYVAAVIDITRTNLAGDVAIYLLAMPLLAFILLRPRAGYIAGGISLVIYWGAAILTDGGAFDSMIINRENPYAMRWWVDAGTTFVLLLVTLLILFHQFFLLLQKTVEVESETAVNLYKSNEQLEQANLHLREANDQLEDKVEQRTEKLRVSERKLMDIIDFLPDATVVIDENGKVVAWNQVMYEITGVKAEDMVGKGKYEYATPFYGERRPTLIDLVQAPNEEFEKRYTYIKRDGSTISGEAYVPNLKGRPAYLFSTASVLKDPDGNYAGAIETVRDITYRKQAEEELRAARDAANAASEAKSTFLASMSHEIRTPLNGIVGMTGLLFDTPLTPEQREFAETIRASGDALLAIINDILDFSKIEAGKMEMEHQPFDLRECVESAVDLLAYRASEKGLEMGVLMDNTAMPPAIIGDVTRLRQVIVNLLGNSVKFTERGEIFIEVTNFRVASEAQIPILHFIVRDTGIGIPADRLDSIFLSFSQVDASTTRKYGGSGLGLAISKRLVELMGGKMWAESVEGMGSAFHFTIQAQPTTLTQDEPVLELPHLKDRRLLIVDDNETNRRILTLQAENWEMIPVSYASPLAALNAMKAGERFDLAILDMHMPEMDGIVLSQEIRKIESEQTSPTPLIMLTSLGWRDLADISNFASFLTKPVKQSNLYNAMVGALSGGGTHPISAVKLDQVFDSTLATRIPLRILLAEDNAVNQKLALRMLERMGYRADVAGNGLEVLDALERQHYDLIFMDVQMPEMDGLETTRVIRHKLPRERQPHIIAMTANAMQGDREECLAAGMNDYVSKPIKVQELQAALEGTVKNV